MAAWSKIVTVALRISQLICAIIMVGIASDYIAKNKEQDLGHLSRFIFTLVVSAFCAFFAFIWLIPFSSNYMNWYIDGIACLFLGGDSGWLIYYSAKKCGEASSSDVGVAVDKFDDDNALPCEKWKALYVFAIISAALWLISAGVGFFWVKKNLKYEKVKQPQRPHQARRRRR
ncbi:integral membrane [Fusarium albosuccineum]|uniref:Integral membrane n=1 Tax=Fusarium albosuccineum TaxID=1237068 RepID=A0A8H4KPW3_9HYPO|nr:integral membrane [Fusarium albosuccineum]